MPDSPDSKDDGLSFTADHLIDQIGHLIPQIHLTLVSVLQSVALAFLLASVRGPASGSLDSIWPALLEHHFYLPHIGSLFVVIITWNEYAEAMLFLHWPLTMFSTTLQFIVAAVEVAAFTNVDRVDVWAIWIGILALLAVFIHQRNGKVISDDFYPHGSIPKIIGNTGEWIYWLAGSSLVILGLLHLYAVFPFALTVNVGSVHLALFDIVVPLMFLVFAFIAMRGDDTFYIDSINQIFESSPYRLEKNGKITKKRPTVVSTMANDGSGDAQVSDQ